MPPIPRELMKTTFSFLAILGMVLFAAPAVAAEGVLIDGVSAGSAAEKAGVKGGDRIVEMSGRPIRSLSNLESVLRDHEAGDQMLLTVLRDGKRWNLRLTLDGVAGGSPRMGVMLNPMSQNASDRSKPISMEDRRQSLTKIATELRSGYLYEHKGNAFAAQVEKAAAIDQFKSQSTLGEFVTAVNGFLLEISNDKHLRLMPGEVHDENAGPRRVTKGGHAPGGGAPGGSEDPDDGHEAETLRTSMMSAYGVREARVLDGNIGYLEMGMFAGSEAAKPKIDAAMMSLAGADALIIDLGRNGGGGPWMVRYLSGFFFSGPTHLTDTWARGMDSPRGRWTTSPPTLSWKCLSTS